MVTFSAAALFVTLRVLLLSVSTSPVEAVPVTSTNTTTHNKVASTSSSYWVANIQRQGTVAFGDSSYKVFRNVQDYGATGDGTTDDTAAINAAITDGNRCGQGCDSSTVTPALVYFPPGTYIVSAPIIQYYYTQFVGDAVSIPTLKASASFTGIAVIDSDPYTNGDNWYTNQNNFYRQVRNFIIDITSMPATSGACIHWQVAQATSLQNIVFEMVQGGTGNQQSGIFMDNGSGGFYSDLVFNGGNYGMFVGNQQFTTRNLTFNHVNTAVFMNWNWVWNLKSLNINNCGVGVNMSNLNPVNETVGSVLIQDSKFVGTPQGVITAFTTKGNTPTTGNTLVIDNCDFTGSTNAVVSSTGATILAGGSVVSSWAQGNAYSTGGDGSASAATCASAAASATSTTIQGTLTPLTKPATLMDGSNIFERSKPQYESVPSSSFVSVKAAGAKGDGSSDDTAAIQSAMNSLTSDQILYFDHGAYVITSTVKVPSNIKMTGEIWPLIMASGTAFANQASPAPVFQVGQPGDTGAVEMSDLIFETKGPAPGAIMVEWNVAESSQGASGMWDVHMRIGGSAGTSLQSNTCAKNPNVTASYNANCEGAFLLLHVTTKATIYLENNWFWVADHELDLSDHNQINIYNGRGILVESQGPVWMYGTSSEHSQLYNFEFANAQNVYAGVIQSETPYMQSNPTALNGGFPPSDTYFDPDFSSCNGDAACEKAWGLRIFASTDILVYGAGLYSFFDNYDQTCLATESCQVNMVSIECSTEVYLWALSTKASTNMVTVDGTGVVNQSDNMSNFCQTIAVFEEA
ncbi:MAG: hypothetical protein Q9161_002257 [Pseudevernia consocians]